MGKRPDFFKLLADVMSLLGSYSSHELAAARRNMLAGICPLGER